MRKTPPLDSRLNIIYYIVNRYIIPVTDIVEGKAYASPISQPTGRTPPQPGGLSHPAGAGRRREARIRHHEGSGSRHRRSDQHGARHALRLHQADAQGRADRRDQRAPRPRARRLAPPLLRADRLRSAGASSRTRAAGAGAAARPAEKRARRHHSQAGGRVMMLAERLYRLLLHLYPLDYRREYGDLMLTHFRDLLRDAQRSERAFAEEKLVLHILLDTLHSAAREHLDAHQVGLAADLRQAKPLPLLTRLLALAPAFLYVLFYSLNEVGVTVPPALIIAAACGVLLVTLWAWIKSLRRGSSIIPGWLMYSAGSLTIVLVFALSRLPTPVGTVVLLALATAGLVVTAMGVHRFRHRYHTPRLAWGLLAALVAVFTASHLPDLLTGILSLPFL